MRRRRLRAALLVVVATALAGIGYGVFQRMSVGRTRALLELGADFLPEAAQRIRNFRRVKMANGRVVWEITAEDAQYYQKQDEVVVREPRLTVYLENGTRRAQIAGTEGRIGLEGPEVRTVTLRGAVTARLDDLELETDEATYDSAADLLRAPGTVQIRGQRIDVRGRGLEVAVTPQQLRLLENVETVVRTAHAAS